MITGAQFLLRAILNRVPALARKIVTTIPKIVKTASAFVQVGIMTLLQNLLLKMIKTLTGEMGKQLSSSLLVT